MDIDDEYEQFMRLTHKDVAPESSQYAIMRTTFFAGMMAMYGVLHGGKPKQQVHVLVDVRKQLMRHVQRADAGMEPGFTNTNFGE